MYPVYPVWVRTCLRACLYTCVLTRERQNLYLDFLYIFLFSIYNNNNNNNYNESEDRTWIDSLDEADVLLLRPRFLAEVTSLFDSSNKPLQKRKPYKSNRKSGKFKFYFCRAIWRRFITENFFVILFLSTLLNFYVLLF